jgi:hypothetical protein
MTNQHSEAKRLVVRQLEDRASGEKPTFHLLTKVARDCFLFAAQCQGMSLQLRSDMTEAHC